MGSRGRTDKVMVASLLLVTARDGVRKVGHLRSGGIWLIADCEEAHSPGKGAGISRPMGFSIGRVLG